MSLTTSLNLRAGRALITGLVILAAGCTTTPGNSSTQAGNRSIESRLRELEDEKEIRGLLVQYGQYLDALKLAEFSQLFAREGTWAGKSSDYVPIKGPANIEAMLKKAYETRVYDPAHITNVHVISNVSITVRGDRASGYAKWTVLSRNEKDEPFVRQNGYYQDEYIREEGRWKFLSRLAHRDIP